MLSNQTNPDIDWGRPVLLLSAQCRAWAHTCRNIPIGMGQTLAPSWQAPSCLDLVGRDAFLRPLLSLAACPRQLLWLHCGGLGTASMSLRSSRFVVIASAADSSEIMLGLRVAAGSVTSIKQRTDQKCTS